LLIICAGSLLDVVYFFPVIRSAFFGKMPASETLDTDLEPKVAPYTGKGPGIEYSSLFNLYMVIPLFVTAIFSIIYCLFPNTFNIYALAQMAVKNTFGGM
jgi:hypothetical protein